MRDTRSLSVAEALSQRLGSHFQDGPAAAVSGGSINSALKYSSATRAVFVKISNAPNAAAMFEAEAEGLITLAAPQAVRVPQVLAHGQSAEGAFLALEWIEFGDSSRASEATLGEQLAWQHRSTQPRYGWGRDNTIGLTPQRNAWCSQWPEFYRDRRLRVQLELAATNGADKSVLDRGFRLCEQVPEFFTSYKPAASLLHGDLWGGNWRCDLDGMPVIFDPAVYYGDRETDIAMTRLFGGFAPASYAAYLSTWPLDAGAPTRIALYNLYHVLNHFNLFGGAYLAQAERMIDGLLAEVG